MLIAHIPMSQHHTHTQHTMLGMLCQCGVFGCFFSRLPIVPAAARSPNLPPLLFLPLSLSLSFSLSRALSLTPFIFKTVVFTVIFNKSQYTRLIEQQSNHNCLFLRSMHSHTFAWLPILLVARSVIVCVCVPANSLPNATRANSPVCVPASPLHRVFI